MSNPVRIGVVGAGAMGEGHLKVWQAVDGAQIAAICDPNLERAARVSNEYGGTAFSEIAEMLDSGAVDAIDICTPSGLHGDQAILAVERGIHALVEKPLDLNLAKVDRLIETSERTGAILGCIFQRRTYPGAQKVAESVHRGDLGRLLSISAYVKWWRAQSYYDSAAWRGTWALDGGVLANQAIHAIDHICWLAGPVAEVEYAHLETANHQMDAEDFAIAVLRFESGARGVIEATTCCTPDLASRIELFGTRGSAAFDDATVVKFGIEGEDRMSDVEQPEERIGGRSDPMAISLRGHQILAQDFADSIREGRQPLISAREARMSVDALTKIYTKAFPGIRLGT